MGKFGGNRIAERRIIGTPPRSCAMDVDSEASEGEAHIQRVLPHLLIGDIVAAQSAETLAANGVTRVVDLSNMFPGANTERVLEVTEGLDAPVTSRLEVQVEDLASQDMSWAFEARLPNGFTPPLPTPSFFTPTTERPTTPDHRPARGMLSQSIATTARRRRVTPTLRRVVSGVSRFSSTASRSVRKRLPARKRPRARVLAQHPLARLLAQALAARRRADLPWYHGAHRANRAHRRLSSPT